MNNSKFESSSKPIAQILMEKTILGASPVTFTLRDSPYLDPKSPASGGVNYQHPCQWWNHELLASVTFTDGSTVDVNNTIATDDDFAQGIMAGLADNGGQADYDKPKADSFVGLSGQDAIDKIFPPKTTAMNARETMAMSQADEQKLGQLAARLAPGAAGAGGSNHADGPTRGDIYRRDEPKPGNSPA